MPTIKERALAALAELDQLQMIRPSEVDKAAKEELITWALRRASYDWAAINATMFPDGNPLALDLSDPMVAAAWKAVRQQQRGLAERALAEAWDQRGTYVFEDSGVHIELDTAELRQMDRPTTQRGAILALLVRHFPECWTSRVDQYGAHHGTTRPYRTDYSSPRIEYLTTYLRHVTLSTFGVHIASSFEDDGNPYLLEGTRESLRMLSAKNWTNEVRRANRDYDLWHARSRAVPPPDTHTRVAEFLQRRLDKARQNLVIDTALDQFTALPMVGARAKAAKAGRTWGIELEIIDAGAIAWDAAGGWKRERDGSLRQQIGDGRVYDPWEFISPVLDGTFSPGLWMICDQAKNTVKYYKAGVHVHVSAVSRPKRVFDPASGRTKLLPGKRMTTAQVSRLIELYAAVSPLLDPIIQRPKTREFCVPTRVDQWAKGWFEAPTSKKPHRVRPLRARKVDAIENAEQWAQITRGPNHDNEPTEWKRHQELNLQSLNKYGTIEFRSMGAVYDYEYLTRWAWLCRTMVDYAQSDAPIGAVYQITDFDSLVRLLMPHATEKLSLKKKPARKAA